MMPPSQSFPVNAEDMLIGALLRVPAQAIHRRLIAELNAAGFDDLRLPHIAVLQFPGPDEARPATLAERAGMSKQAMNQLLGSLEGFGYIVRTDAPGEGGARFFADDAGNIVVVSVKGKEVLRVDEKGILVRGTGRFTRPTCSVSGRSCSA